MAMIGGVGIVVAGDAGTLVEVSLGGGERILGTKVIKKKKNKKAK